MILKKAGTVNDIKSYLNLLIFSNKLFTFSVLVVKLNVNKCMYLKEVILVWQMILSARVLLPAD